MEYTHTLLRKRATNLSGHIRTEGAIKGNILNPAEVGGRLAFSSDPLTGGASMRYIETSQIISLTINEDGIHFVTETGSEYLLKEITNEKETI